MWYRLPCEEDECFDLFDCCEFILFLTAPMLPKALDNAFGATCGNVFVLRLCCSSKIELFYGLDI